MSILVVGSVAYDDLETPVGKREKVLGGAATHFSTAASFFTEVHLVGMVGGDFEHEHLHFLKSRGIDISGLEVVPNGKTFHWAGHYLNDLNRAETLSTELGVFATFDPKLSDHHRTRRFAFLANIHPQLQLSVLNQMESPQFVAMDTMNWWITTERDALQKVIERVDGIFINDGEAVLLTGESNVMKSAEMIMKWGPSMVVIKRGEHGALLFQPGMVFSAPGLPLTKVTDPTGAGDTFAGGFLGYLAREKDKSPATLKRAVICGSVMASFQVEDFGLNRLKRLTPSDIEDRFRRFKDLSHFDGASVFA